MSRGPAKPRRRYLQISLRAMLILVAVCAVWFGVLAKRAHDQRAAVRRVIELGGRVVYDFQYDDSGEFREYRKDAKPPGWPWLRKLVGDEFFQEVVRVSLDGKNVTDDDLELIGKLRHLDHLSLNETSVSDSGLAHVRDLVHLQYLGLNETRVTSSGLEHVSNMKELDILVLGDSPVGDEGLEHLSGLHSLAILNLSRTRVTSAGIAHLGGL